MDWTLIITLIGEIKWGQLLIIYGVANPAMITGLIFLFGFL
jgi:hypothetical protein